MVGRSCYGRPWFPGQLASHFAGRGLPDDPDLQAECDILLRHYASMLDHFGEGPGLRLARKHVGWYSAGLPGSAAFRASVNQITCANAARSTIARFYDDLIERGFSRSPDTPATDPIAWAA